MKTFKDNAGREWQLAINAASLRRVRDLLDVDLLDVADGPLLERLSSDPILLVDVLYVLCQPQCEAQNVTDVQFGEAMAGDAIEQATDALLEEMIGFFPGRRRAILQKLMTKLKQAEASAMDLAEQEIDRIDLDAELKTLIDGGASSGGQPA